MKTGKKRLDLLLVERGLAESRERARTCIMAGEILVNGQVEDKAGACFSEDASIEVRGKGLKYVSRGGLKLEKAIEVFRPEIKDSVCLDIGASTGGFTDCLLQNGAKRVYAVDVGYGQLSWKLRTDERVVVLEKTNFRYVKPGDLPEAPDFVSCDVSFISLSRILPAAYDVMKDGSSMVCLIKPQFEAGREKVGKKGVVRDPKVHEEVISDVIKYAMDCGFTILGLDFSPIRGPEGNIEYLLYIIRRSTQEPQNPQVTSDISDDRIKETVRKAHEQDQ